MARETRRVTKKKVIKNIAAGVAHVNSLLIHKNFNF